MFCYLAHKKVVGNDMTIAYNLIVLLNTWCNVDTDCATKLFKGFSKKAGKTRPAEKNPFHHNFLHYNITRRVV